MRIIMSTSYIRTHTTDPPPFFFLCTAYAHVGTNSPASSMAEPEETVKDLKKQLQDKSLELEKEIALRKLLNSQKDEQAKKLRAAEKQLEQKADLTPPAEPETHSQSPATTDRERLLTRLRKAEEENQQLKAGLCSSEAELQSLKLSQARVETANSAKAAAQSAVITERLSTVQRERQNALTAQLRVALKERQEALEKLSILQHREETAEKAQSTEFEQVFEEMRAAKDTFQLQNQGAVLVEKVRALRENFSDGICEKIRRLNTEKRAAEDRAQGLASDVSQLQKQLEMTKTEYKLVDKTRIKALQAQLIATIEERDGWEERANKLEDTIETLRILSSLQRSLRTEDDIKRKYDFELQKKQAERDALAIQLEQAIQERNTAIIERNHIVQERNSLAVQAQQEYERAERFQRLVVVLRKKARNLSASSQASSVQN